MTSGEGLKIQCRTEMLPQKYVASGLVIPGCVRSTQARNPSGLRLKR
jgi:hypothetical protein